MPLRRDTVTDRPPWLNALLAIAVIASRSRAKRESRGKISRRPTHTESDPPQGTRQRIVPFHFVTGFRWPDTNCVNLEASYRSLFGLLFFAACGDAEGFTYVIDAFSAISGYHRSKYCFMPAFTSASQATCTGASTVARARQGHVPDVGLLRR